MHKLISGLFVISLLLSVASCNRNAVKLSETNADGEVSQLGNLYFRFNRSLYPDSLLNRWDSSEFVRFTPKITGRFRWQSPDELVFSPSQPLPPATNFSAEISSEVFRYTEFSGVENKKKLMFHTPNVKLEEVNVTWVILDQQISKAVPQIDMYFNNKVDPADLKELLSVVREEEKLPFTIQTQSADNKISVVLPETSFEDKDYAAKVIVAKGFKPVGGVNKTDKDDELKFIIPSPYTLTINNVVSSHNGLEGTVYVRTSQQVSGNIKEYLSIDPEISFQVEAVDDGFMVRSASFNADKAYEIKMKQGLKGKIGGTLKETHYEQVSFGELEPELQFTNSNAVYLGKEGARNIEIKLVNVAKVKLIVSKIYESNILMAGRYGYYPRESDPEYDYYGYENNYGTLGDVIYEKEISVAELPQYGNSRLLHFNFADKVPDFKGVYHIVIRSTEDYWISDSRLVSLSDIGLIAKEGEDRLFVFANSIKTTTSLKDVNITVYGNNNQVLGIGSTNADGVAEITYIKRDARGFKPAMVVATNGDDFNYLPFNSTRVNTSRFEVGGKRTNLSGLDAFVYSERDIYRPGEKIHFALILRDAEWKSPGEIPVKFRMLMPNGKELKAFRKNLDAQGSAEGSVEISSFGITGTYTLEVYTSNDVLLASLPFMVEEFVPDRIRVNASLDKSFLKPGEKTTLKLSAFNFFGPPAANRKYEVEFQLKQKAFVPKGYSKYNFQLNNQASLFDKQIKEGRTDAEGLASDDFTIPGDYLNIGILRADIYSTVFDETGRPVARPVNIDVYTQQEFIGIGNDGYAYFPLNQIIRFPVIALDKDGKVLHGVPASVKVIKMEYRTVLRKSGGYFRYESQKQEKLVTEGNLNISGTESAYSFVPKTPGDYEIRIYKPGAVSYVSRKFYSYGFWGGDNNAFEVNREGQIDIETDKSAYNTGETCKVLFKTPFDGKMLVTLENAGVLSYQYVNVDKRAASIDVPLNTTHLPNIYITATLFKEHEVSEIPLMVAHGFQSIRVEEKKRKMNVEITSAESVRSKTRQKVKVKAEPGSRVSLAVVDNGILQVSDFKSPDPYMYFYQQRALEVNAYDLYPYLFPEIRGRLSSTGGDGELSMSKRVNPVQSNRFKLVSFWSGLTTTNGKGEAEFEFDIPQFSGELRVMAVAFKNESFGASEKNMKVADPVVLSTALPRFLSPGDSIQVPVNISNTTSKITNASVQIKVAGPLALNGNTKASVSLAPNGENIVQFALRASDSIGEGKVMVEVQAGGEKFSEEIDIAVRPTSTLQKLSGSGSVSGNQTVKVNIQTSDFMQGSLNYRLVVGKSQVVEIANQLKTLLEYPYGCTEQTISTAFPQLYFSELAALVSPSASVKNAANANVMEAIRKIKMRQLYNGGVMLWENESSEHWWTSVYAAHFLLEAKKAGFEVDPSLLNTLLDYLINQLKQKRIITYYYNRNLNKKIAPKEVAYSLYVLALAGRTQAATMNYYKANSELLSLDSRYILAAAYAMAGDKNKFREILPSSFSGEVSVQQTGGSFYSEVRDEAIALNVLLDVDPGNAQVPVMAKHISENLKSKRYLNTQERVFSFLALGKLAKAAASSDITADIRVNSKSVARFQSAEVSLGMKELGGSSVELVTSGNGTLYYSWVAEGISVSGAYTEEDSYLKVRRQFFDRFGKPLNGNSFRQNDLIVVGITLEKSVSGAVENIVLSDIIPAGFEIENSRLRDLPGMDWIKGESQPVALDIRDDRINIFVDLTQNRQTYYYSVRAVSPGVYRMGPVSADAMYKGEYHSYHGGGIVKILP